MRSPAVQDFSMNGPVPTGVLLWSSHSFRLADGEYMMLLGPGNDSNAGSSAVGSRRRNTTVRSSMASTLSINWMKNAQLQRFLGSLCRAYFQTTASALN